MPVSYKSKPGKILLCALIVIIAGCSLEKQSGFNRAMQNLTANYNILFNANEVLRLKQISYAAAYPDAYNELLSVYPDTTSKTSTPDKDLEDAVVKANKIINIKEQSHYLGDAYLVLGKARYLEGNYFDAVAYFNYVIASYGKQPGLKQEALVWKARALMYLNELPEAKGVIDTAIQNINPKKSITADVYATKLQYDINTQDYPEAEDMAKQAIEHCGVKAEKLRWTFILAQLQELNQKGGDAYNNYTRIVKSNASFEMAFNANLNRIRIQDNQNGVKISKIDLLRSLLKNEDNKDFKDQIYYQIADIYYANGDIDNALKNYKLSVRNSSKNQNQKGLSYLRIADIDFKNRADYPNAKLYYDSTLTYLSPNYPGYQIIRKKSDNLQILTKLIETISREDTLQMLADLDEKTRAARIDAMVQRHTLQQQAVNAAAANAPNPFNNGTELDRNKNPNGQKNNNASTFYFYNTAALSQGFNDFQRLWGNRKLEDNWRRSKRSNTGIPPAAGVLAQGQDPDAPAGGAAGANGAASAGNYRQDLVKNLPLTPELMAQSNTRIYNAYMDLGNFYRDILEDKKEAIANYELLLARFPQSQDKAAVYYNLYRLYADIDPAKSADYKNRILKEYPQTVYAKVILDPDYSKKIDDVNAEFNGFYNQIFELYTQRQYAQVITGANDLIKKYPDNRFTAQLYYLKALAAGHQEKLEPFMSDLQLINSKYPNDPLISPLIAQHLAYIASNKEEVSARPVVLTNDDPTLLPFTPPVAYQKQTEYRPFYKPSPQTQVAQVRLPEKVTTPPPSVPSLIKPPEVSAPIAVQPKVAPPAENHLPVVTPQGPPVVNNQPEVVAANNPPAAPLDVAQSTKQQDSVVRQVPVTVAPVSVIYPFSMRDSSNYYFVVNVSSGTTNVASSRFGIGQFNRTRFSGSTVKHQLKSVGADDQVIYVGRFYSLADVKSYARSIIPLLPDIMKVPRDKYSFFIITKENLDKLADQKTLDSYIDYYQKFY